MLERIAGMARAVWLEMGPQAMPRLLLCHPLDRRALLEEIDDRWHGGVVDWPLAYLETDYGRLEIKARADVPRGQMLLVHDEAQFSKEADNG